MLLAAAAAAADAVPSPLYLEDRGHNFAVISLVQRGPCFILSWR